MQMTYVTQNVKTKKLYDTVKLDMLTNVAQKK